MKNNKHIVHSRNDGEKKSREGGDDKLSLRIAFISPVSFFSAYNVYYIQYLLCWPSFARQMNGTKGRNRTDTMSPSRDFESRASTSSATLAHLQEISIK